MVPDIPRDLAVHPGPIASVYLDVSRDHQDADHEIRLRADALAEKLREQGAPDTTVGVVREAAVQLHSQPGPAGRAVFAADGAILHEADLPAPPRREVGRWALLPHLLPMLAQLPQRVPYLLVRLDKTKASIRGVDRAGREVLGGIEPGRQHPVHKVRGGGLAHVSIQHRTEQVWATNARAFASEVDRAVAQLHAELVVLTGDPRARALVADALGARSRALVKEIAGPGTGDTTTEEDRVRDVEQLAAQRAGRRTAELVTDFKVKAGQGSGLAVGGLVPVIQALQKNQAATVFIRDDPSSDRQFWVGRQPTQLALTRSGLEGLGAEVLGSDRADAAMVRAIAGTGASLVLLPHPSAGTDPRRAGSASGSDEQDLDQPDLPEGTGALLRFASS